jgi:hypothetical protein
VKIQLLIAATLAPFLTACRYSWNCDPPEEQFSVDVDVTEDDVAKIMSAWGYDERGDIGCETLCGYMYQQGRGWELGTADSCEHTIAATAAADPKAVVGHVQCAGRGIKYYCEGRRPLGHVEVAPRSGSLAEHLAACAHLEAASVAAFEQLAALLTEWGAPTELVDRCRVAAREETRHAALLAGLAARGDVTAHRPQQDPVAASRLAIAAHNAAEGCVFEAWAAVRAAWVAARASDPAVRAAYVQIAADEARHAELAWDLHTWLMGQLDRSSQAQVRATQAAAIAALPDVAAGQGRGPGELGMPPQAALVAMAARFAAGLQAA